MDVFEALGLDMPDNTRSMSVTDADADLAGVLGPLFGWDEKDASANSLILFPGESQQGLGELGLLELPSFKLSQRDEQQLPSAAPVTKADPNKASPFSGISQFDLYLGEHPTVQQQDGAFSTSLAPPSVAGGAPAASQPAGAAPAGPEMQMQFSQGLLNLLEDTLGPLGLGEQQQHPRTQQQQQQQQQESYTQVKAEQQQPGALQTQAQVTQQPVPLHTSASPFGAVLPQELLQQQQPLGGSSSNLGMPQSAAATTALAGTQQQQAGTYVMPPPMPHLPVQQQGQQQLAAGLLTQQQQQPMAFQPVLSPLLLQPQQLQLLRTANTPLAVPQIGQQLSPPIMQLPQHMLQQQPAALQQQQQAPQQQQQQMDFQFGQSDEDDVDDNKRLGQAKRRGRPPKVPGQYSKGYEAIKRYREKKKGMVEHMEAEIAQKRSELQKLEAEQVALRTHQQALESTMNNQDTLLAQLLQLKLSIAGREDNAPDLEATTAAAIAGVRQAIAMQNGGDAAAEQAAAAAASAQQHQRLKDKKQLAQKKVMEEGPVFLRLYQGYVQAVADRLSAAAAASGSSESVSAAAVTGNFPTFPFTLVETLSLWTLSRLAIMTRTNFAKLQGAQGASGGGNEEAWDDFTLNLATGQHDLVPEAFWRDVSSKVPLFGEQPVQLGAAWRLYVQAMKALNEERQHLLLKLQEAAAAEEAANVPTWAGPLGDGSGSSSSGTAAPPAAAAAGAGTSAGQVAAGSSRGSSAAAAAAAGGRGAGVRRDSGTPALDVATVYLDLLDAVDRNLLRGRAVVMMFGWSMLCMLSAEQIGLICVHSWPFFPLIRAIVGYMLGKEDFVP